MGAISNLPKTSKNEPFSSLCKAGKYESTLRWKTAEE
jgi:hypothetical protein